MTSSYHAFDLCSQSSHVVTLIKQPEKQKDLLFTEKYEQRMKPTVEQGNAVDEERLCDCNTARMVG